MSIYFALEYDANGVSRIVEKKDTSTRAITQRDFNLGAYVGNQITSPEDPTQPVEDNNTGDFINQMGTGTMGGDDMTNFERFIDRSSLTAFMNEGKGPKDTKFINAVFAALGIPVTAEGLTKFFNGIQKFLPKQSPEAIAIRKFYSTRGPEGGLDYMDPNSPNYIPGMENYNIISGGFLNTITGGRLGEPTQYGLQDAFKDRMSTIAGTLSSASYMSRYGLNRGLTEREIQAIIDGTYAGPVTPLTERYKNLNDVAMLEFNFKDDDDKIDTTDFKTDFKTIDTGVGEFDGGKTGPADSPPIAPPSKLNPPRQDTRPTAPPSQGFGNPPKDDDNRGGSFDTSAADKAGTSVGSGQFSPSTSKGRSGY